MEWCQDHNKPVQVNPFGDVAAGGPVTLGVLGQLGQLRRLEGEGGDLQPPIGPSDLLAQSRDKNEEQEADAPDEQGDGQDLPEAVVQPRRQEHEADPQNRRDGLFFEKMVGIAHPLRAHRKAGAVDHDDPEAHQRQSG